jgi:hypothetical protein
MDKSSLAILVGKLAPKKSEKSDEEEAKLDLADSLIEAVKKGDREGVAACLDDFFAMCDSCEMDEEEDKE